MVELEAVTGWVVHAEHAARVVAPPYDALTAAQREAAAASDPASYLGALPTGAPPSSTEVTTALHGCRAHLERLLADSRFRRLGRPSLLVLAITRDGADGGASATSVAVLGDVDVRAFTDGQVRPHEATDPDRVAHLARYLEVVGVASSPVAVVHRPSEAVTAATAAVRDRPPTLAFTDGARGEHVALWVVDDPAEQTPLRTAVAAAGTGYLADGHHRAAAVRRFAATHALPPGDPATRVLCAVLPEPHLEVTPFHRAVDLDGQPAVAAALAAGDLSGLTRAGWSVREGGPRRAGTVDPWHVPVPGRYHLVLPERWWVVEHPVPGAGTRSGGGRAAVDDRPEGTDPVAALDVVRLDALLDGLGLPTGAARPLAPATPEAAVRGPGGGVLGIALPPPSWAEIRAVADAGRTLPAKTTYLTPKMRSGLVVVPRHLPGS